MVYCCFSRRHKGGKNVHQCQEANADILTAPGHHFTSETLPSGEDIIPIFASPSILNLVLCGFIDTRDYVLLCWRLQGGDELPEGESPCWLSPDPGYGAILFSVVQGIMLHVLHCENARACLFPFLRIHVFGSSWVEFSLCQNLAAGERVLYSLYGIVEHSGSMRVGHYTAYVKVRPPQRKTEQHHKNLSGQGPAFFSTFCLFCLFMTADSVLQPRHHFSWDFQCACIICSSSVFSPKPACPDVQYYKSYSWRKQHV